MLFKTIVSSALLAQALAAPAVHNHHQHNQEKRAVYVVTQTSVVVVTLGAGDATTTLSQVSLSPHTDVSVASPVTDAPQVVPSSIVSESEAPSPVSSETPQYTDTPSTGSGGAKGITYSPYSDAGGCKTSAQIAVEIALLAGFDVIRLYGVDCDQVAQVLKAKHSGQKIFAGIFDVGQISQGIQTIADAVAAHGSWDDIHTISIGNELVNSGQCSPAQIKGYVDEARGALASTGYKGPVVSVDTFIAVINNPSLCQYSDYIAVNAHAFFDGHYTADQAGDWVLSQIQRVWTACGGSKNVLITETGWPSRGESNGAAVPSLKNQQSAISSIKSTCGNSAILFTAFNDLWKADGPFNAEKYWGFLSSA
ncbi:MP65 [Candida oxycetoniae]|uniref:MP65 n=1 Tax=Candida oxycetoniae TaxID=497107 RepID=A0AAI9SXE4_9ASCO|nr:MP65 [Candida oxycetoniae]KAI3404477.1 MP65 [Candida oxycetoniae]